MEERGRKGDAIGKKKEHLSREGHGSEAVNQDGRRPSPVQPFALHGLRRVEESKAVESRGSGRSEALLRRAAT